MATTTTLTQALENFLQSHAFQEGVIDSTRASWGGSTCSVELFPNGSYRVIWNKIGNRYESTGIILGLPVLSTDEMQNYIDDGAGTEDDFLLNEFLNNQEDLKVEMRDAFSFSFQ